MSIPFDKLLLDVDVTEPQARRMLKLIGATAIAHQLTTAQAAAVLLFDFLLRVVEMDAAYAILAHVYPEMSGHVDANRSDLLTVSVLDNQYVHVSGSSQIYDFTRDEVCRQAELPLVSTCYCVSEAVRRCVKVYE